MSGYVDNQTHGIKKRLTDPTSKRWPSTFQVREMTQLGKSALTASNLIQMNLAVQTTSMLSKAGMSYR